MRFLMLVLMLAVAVIAADSKKTAPKEDAKTKTKVVSVECDTTVIIKCTTTKLVRTYKDTTVVVKEEKVVETAVDTVKADKEPVKDTKKSSNKK